MADEYIFDHANFFSWLAAALLSSLWAPVQRQKQPATFSEGAPVSRKKPGEKGQD